jgi:deoxyribonuclease V
MLLDVADWPDNEANLIRMQGELAAACPALWTVDNGMLAVAGCWICHPRGQQGKGSAGDPCWAAAALVIDGRLSAVATAAGRCGFAYEPGLLASREGPWLEKAVRRLPETPDVLLVNATGRDHPRRAGLALHLGAKLSVPTVGVTRQPLIAEGGWPAEERGATAPLRIDGDTVACRLCTRRGIRPLVVHPAWRTDLDTAIAVVLAMTATRRTPEPLRQARRVAREARSGG